MSNQRRSPGDGHLSEVRPGVWRLRVSVHGPDGARRFVTKTVRAKGRKAALAELREFSRDAGAALVEEEPTTFGEVATAWLDNCIREGRIAPSTLDIYRRNIVNHIVPALGTLPVADVKARVLDEFYGSLTLAPTTVRTVHATVMGVLGQAKDWGMIAELPHPRPPAKPDTEKALLTPADVEAVVRAARERNRPELAPFVTLGAQTGARRGELLGLQVADFDRTTCTLSIRRQVTPEHGIQLPKNKRSRVVALGPKTVQAIDDYLGAMRDRFRHEPGPWLLSEDGGANPLTPHLVTDAMASLGKAVGIHFHAHLLRHFHQSQLVSAGVDVLTVARRAGHRPEELLQTYAHSVAGTDQAAAAVLEGLFA